MNNAQVVHLTLEPVGNKKARRAVRSAFKACWTCGKDAGLTCCARCNTAAYCSKACQITGWEGAHQLECKRIIPLKKQPVDVQRMGVILQKVIGSHDWSKYEPTTWTVLFKPTVNPVDTTAVCVAAPGYREALLQTYPHIRADRHVFKMGGKEGLFFEVVGNGSCVVKMVV